MTTIIFPPTRLKYCQPNTHSYTRLVKLRWLKGTLAIASVLLLVGTGCTGINTQQTINPLMFFLPGIGQTKPVEQPVVPTQTASLTHETGATTDLVQLN